MKEPTDDKLDTVPDVAHSKKHRFTRTKRVRTEYLPVAVMPSRAFISCRYKVPICMKNQLTNLPYMPVPSLRMVVMWFCAYMPNNM